jgi:hypothetical protein
MNIDFSNFLTPAQIQLRLDFFNAFRDWWGAFVDVPEGQAVSLMYPSYVFGYRAEEISKLQEAFEQFNGNVAEFFRQEDEKLKGLPHVLQGLSEDEAAEFTTQPIETFKPAD